MGMFDGLKKNNNQTDEKTDPKDELQELQMRVHLASARMKPHYLGNVMSAIFYLCDADTEKAQNTVLALSGYLRQSVEAIDRKELLPFPWELEHIQNYLTLEDLRFENRLRVNYEIDIDDFDIPSLSVQPLVENAVKHGIAPLDRPGTVNILTRRQADGRVRITVSDDGVGFDTSALKGDSEEPHSLECIKRRLKEEVDGEMTVESRPDEGTTVTITFEPKG